MHDIARQDVLRQAKDVLPLAVGSWHEQSLVDELTYLLRDARGGLLWEELLEVAILEDL